MWLPAMQAIAVTANKCAESKLYENAQVFSFSLRNSQSSLIRGKKKIESINIRSS